MASEFVLVTDDSCDLPCEYLKNNGIGVIGLSFHIDGQSYKGADMSPQKFYSLIRQGKMPTTAQVNVGEMIAFFEPYLQQKKDVLYIAFSSGLSGTCDGGKIAAQELAEKYPENRVVVVDSLCASLGQGLFVHKVCERWQAGMGLDELAAWAEDNKLQVAHFVLAEDLMHLHRGGRISKTSAVVGSMLGIKPLIHVDNNGKLAKYNAVRGRKQAMDTLLEDLYKCVGNTENNICMISHADAREDAEYVAGQIRERYKIRDVLIHFIGPVIGSHTGAGTIAIFLMAEHR